MLTGDDLVLCLAPSLFDVADTVRAGSVLHGDHHVDRESSW
jgi:hypothetical protein